MHVAKAEQGASAPTLLPLVMAFVDCYANQVSKKPIEQSVQFLQTLLYVVHTAVLVNPPDAPEIVNALVGSVVQSESVRPVSLSFSYLHALCVHSCAVLL